MYPYTSACLYDHLLKDMWYKKTIGHTICSLIQGRVALLSPMFQYAFLDTEKVESNAEVISTELIFNVKDEMMNRTEIHIYFSRQELFIACQSVLECSHYHTYLLINFYCASTYYQVLPCHRKKHRKINQPCDISVTLN